MPASSATAAVLLCCCCCRYIHRAMACDKQPTLTKPVAGIPPWPADSPPQGQGCFSDHGQNAGLKPPHLGPRLLECGMWGCSGGFGCGGAHVGTGKSKGCPKEDCPPWPSSLPKCDGSKMTPEQCSQLCLAWSPEFRYAVRSTAPLLRFGCGSTVAKLRAPDTTLPTHSTCTA